MVHILGHAPTTAGTFEPPPAAGADPEWTVYVVEPHGNASLRGRKLGALFADARLGAGFVPAAWAADVNADYPATDRQELLVFDGSGSMSSIDDRVARLRLAAPRASSPAPSPRRFIYLLLRILFRRRLVAVLAGLFVLVDGMFFVQSRIGMNDVYVGLFIVAAYTLFAALWTGWWRARWAFWAAMPVIGVLLGLALASKWVALYAIGGLALLILARSALGRVVAILGLIALTCVLGYMAITVPPDSRHREPHVPAGDDGADPGRRRGRGAPSRRVDRRGDALRGPGPDRPRGRWSSSARSGSGKLDAEVVVAGFAATPDPGRAAARAVVARDLRGLRAGRPRSAGARWPPRPDRRIPPGASSRRRRPPRAGSGPAGRSASRSSGPPSACWPCRSRSTSSRTSRGRWSRATGSPRPGRRATPGETLLDLTRSDVRLPQRPDLAASGLVAVVGVADGPQARLVLPGGPRRRDRRRHLRRRATSSSG